MNDFVIIKATKASLSKRKPIYGVAINDAPYNINIKINGIRLQCPFYMVWLSMLTRVYGKENPNSRTYKDVYVCSSWLRFSNFRKWMAEQDWFGKELDKDIIEIGNKCYSPSKCVFVDKKTNMLLTGADKIRGKFKKGVSFHKATGMFRAKCSIDGLDVELCHFKTESEAYDCYVKNKSLAIIKCANKQTDLRVKEGLMNHARALCGQE